LYGIFNKRKKLKATWLKSAHTNQARKAMEVKNLATHLKNRPEQLREAKKTGTKIIGYFPGNYVPEEIIYASGRRASELAEKINLVVAFFNDSSIDFRKRIRQ
jgi:hypothetical protein